MPQRDLLACLAARLPDQDAARIVAYRPAALRRALARELRRRGVAPGRAARHLDALRPAEARDFFEALLLPVSEFFRDPEAFAELDAALPARPLRILSAPCASGEEAWSLAALCRRPSRHASRVLALDLHGPALARAREGLYPAAVARKLTPGQRALLFAPFSGATPPGFLAVHPDLAPAVEFARADLTRRFPPGPFDLIACRNLLIYLEPAAQRLLLDKAVAALAPGGLLLLGGAERPPDGAAALGLEPAGRHKLYRKIAGEAQAIC